MTRKRRFCTRLEILKLASEMFLSQGYTTSSTKKMAQKLGISVGNLAYHFPTKEHLLVDMTEHLCDYHFQVMESKIDDGRTSLMAYLLELTSMMAICEDNDVAKDLYTSVYKSPMALSLIRKADTQKATHVFAAFCPEWTQDDFILAENIVSGIEYASLMPENAEYIPLEERICRTLDAVLRVYRVPREIRQEKIQKILSIDYRRIGQQFIEGFTEYVERVKQQALDQAYDQMDR